MAHSLKTSHADIVALVLVLALAAAAPVLAQDEPTPAPETPPATEAPPAEETEPAAAAEPAPAAAPAPIPQQAGVPKVYRDKTLITIDGRAEMNGIIELVVQPDNEEPKMVRLNVVAKTKKKKITKALTEQLVFTLGDGYKVKQTGDRTIRVVSKKKNPPVAIWLLTQNLAGVSVMVGNG
jgi:hypothetical protein